MNIQIYNPETNTIDFDLVLQILEFQKLKETPQHSWWHEEGDALEFGEWVPGIDSHISVVGLQNDERINWRVRKLIGENM